MVGVAWNLVSVSVVKVGQSASLKLVKDFLWRRGGVSSLFMSMVIGM